MAKIAICDQCGRQQPLHLGSLTPGGWLEVQEHSTGPNPPAFLVCSFGCLGAYGSAENAKRTAAEAARTAAVHGRPRRLPGGHVTPGRFASLGDAAWMAEAEDNTHGPECTCDDCERSNGPRVGREGGEAGHVMAAQADSSDE